MSGLASTGWPARIIHVNEDGWVLINRGSARGVAVGLRLLAVTAGTRELRDLYPEKDALGLMDLGSGSNTDGGRVVFRFRRTFELLEVIHVENACAVAIAARVPAERRPTVYRGAEGELLVWVPLSLDYVYPLASGDDDSEDGSEDGSEEDPTDDENAVPASDDTQAPATADPVGSFNQEDDLWSQSLPLNGLHVGDVVVPAIPASTDQRYDWMK